MSDERELAPGEWSVLGLLAGQPAHGWALATALAPDGEIGCVWSLGRPLVYRSLEILEKRGLVEPGGLEASVRGPKRTVYRVTGAGREALDRWLEERAEQLEAGAASRSGAEGIMGRFRLETARAALRFVESQQTAVR